MYITFVKLIKLFSLTTVMNEFRECNTLEKRISSSEKVMNRYPDKVPIIVVLPKEFKKKSFLKYLVSKDLNVQYIMQLVRKNIKLDSSKAIFVLTESGVLSTANYDIGDLYYRHKNEDGYLYLCIKVEVCFGN
jgi:GABA(A) receptor-associated protein